MSVNRNIASGVTQISIENFKIAKSKLTTPQLLGAFFFVFILAVFPAYILGGFLQPKLRLGWAIYSLTGLWFYYCWTRRFDFAGYPQFKFSILLTLKIVVATGLITVITYFIGMAAIHVWPWQLRLNWYDDGGFAVALPLFVSFSVVAPILEEILCRGLLMRWLLSLANIRLVVVAQAVIFAALHGTMIESGDFLRMIQLFAMGTMLGLVFLHFNTIWAPIAAHFAWNTSRNLLFSFEPLALPALGREQEIYNQVFKQNLLITEILFWLVAGVVYWWWTQRGRVRRTENFGTYADNKTLVERKNSE